MNDSFERRNALDYHDFTTITKSEIQEYYINIRNFVTEIDKIFQKRLLEHSEVGHQHS
ncbi:MAG: hypothetical protein M1480_17630 [Bacteroidetes bacterium]|nr:hypothetical protein [Bacteroidota bacterium]